MAIFGDVSEIDRTSGFTKKFDKTTGIRKFGLAMLGYNDKGEKNLWGYLNPMSYSAPGLQHTFAKGLATGDTDKVLGENTAEAWNSQISSMKLASNFIPGVGIVGKMGINAGLSVGQSAIKGGDTKQAATDGATTVAGTALVNEAYKSMNKEKAMDALNAKVDAVDVVDEVLPDEADYSVAPNEMIEGAEAANTATKGAKLAKGLGTAANILSIAGDTAEVVQSQMSYNKGLKNSRKKILKQSVISAGPQNYL